MATASDDDGPVLDEHGAAAVLGLDVGTVLGLCRTGSLPHHRVPQTDLIRFLREELLAWMARNPRRA